MWNRITTINDARSALIPLDLRASEFGFLDGNVGVGTDSPDGRLHVYNGSAGTWTPHAYWDDLIIENSDHGGLVIVTPDDKSKESADDTKEKQS